jgi:hypothetical protein
LKWLFRASILSFILLGCLIVYFGEKAPTAADGTSGHVYPFYDKLHRNYVYLTELENNSIPVLCVLGVGGVFCCVFIDFKLRRSVTPSEQNRRQRERQDHDD